MFSLKLFHMSVIMYRCLFIAIIFTWIIYLIQPSIFLGQSMLHLLNSLNNEIKSYTLKCTVANNEKIDCESIVTIPICLQTKVKVFDKYIVPKLTYT